MSTVVALHTRRAPPNEATRTQQPTHTLPGGAVRRRRGRCKLTILPLKGGELRTVRTEAVPEGRGNFDAFGALGDGRLVLDNPGSGFRPDLAPGLQWVQSEIVVLDPTDGSSRIVGRLPSRQQFILDGGDTKLLAPACHPRGRQQRILLGHIGSVRDPVLQYGGHAPTHPAATRRVTPSVARNDRAVDRRASGAGATARG